MLLPTLAAALLIHAAPPADTSLAALRRQVEAIAAASGATVGVGVVDLETDERWSVNGTEAFPLQSVFKLSLALLVLKRAEAGALRLDARVPVARADLRPGFSPLADRFPNEGTRFTLRELLRRAVSESDNTAADLLLRRVGGPAAVTRHLRAAGIRGFRVDRGEGELALDYHGIARGPGRGARDAFAALLARQPADARRAAFEAYIRDPRDTATPEAAASLLALLWRGRALRPAGTALLLRMLTETPTGPNRLRGMLPAGTPVAHKTGTAGEMDGVAAVVNDVGIVTLPNGRHVVVAVLVKRATRGIESGERAIATIARAVHDHYAALPPRR